MTKLEDIVVPHGVSYYRILPDNQLQFSYDLTTWFPMTRIMVSPDFRSIVVAMVYDKFYKELLNEIVETL